MAMSNFGERQDYFPRFVSSFFRFPFFFFFSVKNFHIPSRSLFHSLLCRVRQGLVDVVSHVIVGSLLSLPSRDSRPDRFVRRVPDRSGALGTIFSRVALAK